MTGPVPLRYGTFVVSGAEYLTMRPDLIIAPSPVSDWSPAGDTLALARTKQGKVFRKHILNYGDLLHPVTGSKIKVDDTFVATLKQNFENNVCDIVQVPLANKTNEHDESPDRNIGEVVGIESDSKSGKVYALVDARKHAEDLGKTLLGASAFMHLNYKDSKSGKQVGPTLLHVAVTNRPYITSLDSYEEVVAASAEVSGNPALVRMSGGDAFHTHQEAHVPRSLNEILAELASDHGIAVDTALSADDLNTKLSAGEQEGVGESVAKQLIAALQGTVGETKLSASDISTEEIVAGVAELANRHVALSNTNQELHERVQGLEDDKVAKEVHELVLSGRILPSKEEAMLTLALSNREAFDAILPDEPLLAFSAEQGTSPRPSETSARRFDVDAELARLTASDGPAAEYIG